MEETRLEQETPPEGKADFDELLRTNREYQSAFDKRVDKALQTARVNWERGQAETLEAERAQALAQARAQAAAEYQARCQELEEREGAFRRRERELEVGGQLVRLGLPQTFAPWLTGETGEESARRVTEFDAAFRAAVSEAVTGRMTGMPPADPVPAPAFDRESLRGMSPREINAHWAEIQNTLKG